MMRSSSILYSMKANVIGILMVCFCFTVLCACDDEADSPFGIRVNMELRALVVGATDSQFRIPDEKVNLVAYRRTYNAALFKWEADERIEIDLYTQPDWHPESGYTPYWRFHHYLYWRAPNHHDEIVMRAKLASQDDNQWKELKFTYEDAREYDDDEVTVKRTINIAHPDY